LIGRVEVLALSEKPPTGETLWAVSFGQTFDSLSRYPMAPSRREGDGVVPAAVNTLSGRYEVIEGAEPAPEPGCLLDGPRHEIEGCGDGFLK